MFEFLVTIFDIFLYWPLFNFLVLTYNYLPGHDFGFTIIFMTIVIRIILYPLSIKALKSQKTLQRLQPKIQEIQKKYKDDKEKQAKETLELYRTEKINPFSGLFLAFLQFPILIALYRVFGDGLKVGALSSLYSFVANPGHISPMFLAVDLSLKGNWVFAILAGILQFFQTKMLLPSIPKNQNKETDMSLMIQNQMVYFFPFVTVVILINLPAALGLYWIVSGLFSIIQQYFILKKLPQHDNPGGN